MEAIKKILLFTILIIALPCIGYTYESSASFEPAAQADDADSTENDFENTHSNAHIGYGASSNKEQKSNSSSYAIIFCCCFFIHLLHNSINCEPNFAISDAPNNLLR